MMGIESWMFSTQWAPKLSISDLAWLDSWPNTIYSLMDLREYNLSFHTYWFFELLSFSSLYSFTASSKWVASCFHFFGPLLWCVSNLLALLPCFPTSPSGSRDEVRLTSVCGMRCSCCCWLCQFPFNVTLGVGRRPFEKYCSLLVLWRTSWLQKKMNSFARITILDPAILSVVPNMQHWGCTFKNMELFEELCNRTNASPLPDPVQMVHWCQKDCLATCVLLLTSWN